MIKVTKKYQDSLKGKKNIQIALLDYIDNGDE